ncbi:Chloride channel protein CLC-c-like protein [Drosera capensis]
MLIAAQRKKDILQFKKMLGKEFEMKDLGATKKILDQALMRQLMSSEGTTNCGILFDSQSARSDVVGMVDVDYAGNLDSKRSTNGYEKDVHICDSQSAIYLVRNQVLHARTEYIDVRYHKIREWLTSEIVDLKWRSALLWRTFFTTAVVAIVLRAFIEFCSTGKCGLFGNGGLIMYDVSSAEGTYSGKDLLAVLFLGGVGGIFGSIYNYLIDKVLRVYSIINEKGPYIKILLVIFISVLTTACSFGLPWLVKCTACPSSAKEECPSESESGNYKSFQCESGYYNDLASLFLNTNDDAIRNLFSTSTEKEFKISSLFIFFTTIYFLGIITYGIAIPAGLFIPVILAGATYGRLVGRLFDTMSTLDPGLFALLGAASFLGGTMRMTVSLCVILLELTNDLLLLPLVMLVLLISKTVADCFNKGVYDQIVKLKGLPYMEAHAEPYMRQLVAGDVVTGPLVTFAGVEKVANIVHSLQLTNHNAFPVVDEPPFSDAPELCGLVLRSHLLVLLKAKYFSEERELNGRDILKKFSPVDFAKPGSGKGIKIEDITFEEEEMEMYIDLHPITNASPYTVVETMSLAKAAILFRELALRHMCVVPKSQGRPPIVGILTRHDFTPEHVLGLYPHIKGHKACCRNWESTARFTLGSVIASEVNSIPI